MANDQIILFVLLGLVFGLLIWGRIRYDLVAFGALVAAVVIGVVPESQAFSGFGLSFFLSFFSFLSVSSTCSTCGATRMML